MNDDATQFSYFNDNELTQLVDIPYENITKEKNKALEIGTLFLKKYKILKVLGEGSFSLIYLLEATDASKKLLVAKEFFPKGFVTRNENNEVILKDSLTEKEKENFHFMKDIFIGEAQNLVKVSSRTHQNVLSFFALEEDVNNTLYLITDHEKGITLKEYIRKHKKENKGKLDNQTINKIIIGLLDALAHVHNVNVYHQDIKLENILIRDDDTPLLLDFGASVILYDEKRKKYFNATTPRYAAPEQVKLDQPPKINQTSDIYSMGVLLYKLITDTFPPKASERLKSIETQKVDPYISLEIQKPYGYSINLLQAVDKALQLAQNKRFQNVNDFKLALLRKEKKISYPLIISIILLSFIGVLSYFMSSTSKGTAKLDLIQKKYIVYSDGERVPLSEEKTILLSSGIHNLTIIKDDYVPYETNVSIKPNQIITIKGKLTPSKHIIYLSSNIPNANFIVNGKALKENHFLGKYGESYTIKTIAKYYIIKETKVTYVQLDKKDYRFYQLLQLDSKNINLTKLIHASIGKTNIKINGEIINNNTFIAHKGKEFIFDIFNPYYKIIHEKRTYEQLENTFILTQGIGQLTLSHLPDNVKITLYRKNANNLKELTDINITYKNNIYTLNIPASDMLYLHLNKEGYETFDSTPFNIKHNEKINQNYTLKKIATPKVLVPLIEVETEQPKKDTQFTDINESFTTKPVIKLQTKVKKIKEKSKRPHKKIASRKKKVIKKKVKKSMPSKHQWYCIVNSNGAGSWSAKSSSRSRASSIALNKCRKRKSFCRISSCYIWGGR